MTPARPAVIEVRACPIPPFWSGGQAGRRSPCGPPFTSICTSQSGKDCSTKQLLIIPCVSLRCSSTPLLCFFFFYLIILFWFINERNEEEERNTKCTELFLGVGYIKNNNKLYLAFFFLQDNKIKMYLFDFFPIFVLKAHFNFCSFILMMIMCSPVFGQFVLTPRPPHLE